MKKIILVISFALISIANINKGGYTMAQESVKDSTSAVISISPEEQEMLENLDLLMDYEMFENLEILENYQILWEDDGTQNIKE